MGCLNYVKDKCVEGLQKCWKILGDWLYDIFIITRKNMRIRLRRFVVLTVEVMVPILIVAILAMANGRQALLRVDPLEFSMIGDDLDQNDTLEGYYDPGQIYSESDIMKHLLCVQSKDPIAPKPNEKAKCRIGFVADEATRQAIFYEGQFRKHFEHRARFIPFENEQAIYDCLEAGNDCYAWSAENDPDAILKFRGAVIFETSVNDREVRYKIRLMEKYYGSLQHVMKTTQWQPSIYDRRQYSRSYLDTGFLALQLIIDRQIILRMKDVSTNPEANKIVFNDRDHSDCTCRLVIHEIPHRQTDQSFYPDDPFEYDANEEDDYTVIGKIKNQLVSVKKDNVDIVNQVYKQSLIVPTILVLCFTFLVPLEQRRTSSEKENGLTILLLITGMTYRMQWIGNLVAVTVCYIPVISVVVLLLKVELNRSQGPIFEFVSWPVLWLLIFLYVVALASASYFTTVFFEKPMTAIAASICFWSGTFVVTVYHLDYYYDIMPIPLAVAFCLHPCIALQFGFRILILFERHKIKTNIFNMSRIIQTDRFSVLYIVCFLIVDVIIYMGLTMYLDRILKSKFGVKKSWYYICTPSEYRSRNPTHVRPIVAAGGTGTAAGTPKEDSGFEPCHEEDEPSIVTYNLTKKYGKVEALTDLNIRLYHGEIFALLGPNGSGKSTLLNLFSGFTAATSGTAVVCGYDIRTHMVQIQEILGMCPQDNFLYEDLTPLEHLVIFGRLRGLRHEASGDSMELLEKVRIHEMAHWSVRKLSRGDKRKLSLAIALIGDPKVLLLDEPTKGLDYYSRRAVWDLLLKIRSNHTIIFSTHFMDEAELLGDRIGILSSGKMQVCGSHAFLRRHFGLGYSLKIKVHPEAKPRPQAILRVIRDAMPKATLCTLPISPNASRLCTYNLPLDGYSSEAMSTLFSDLAREKAKLSIVGFSVENSTMDEIFLELMRKINPDKNQVVQIENEEIYHTEGHEENIRQMFTVRRKFTRFLIQFLVLNRKRAQYTWRSWKIVLFQIILPAFLFFIGIYRLSTHINVEGRLAPALPLTLANREEYTTLFYATDNTFIKREIAAAVIGPTATLSSSSDLSGEYIHTPFVELRKSHLVGLSAETGDKGALNVHASPYFLHSAPIALSLYSNSLVKFLDEKRSIVTINHPLQHPYFTGGLFEDDVFAPDITAMIKCLSLSVTLAFSVVFPVEERLNGVKHLQMMCGVSPLIYWLAIFIWDCLIIMVFQGVVIYLLCILKTETKLLIVDAPNSGMKFGSALYNIGYVYCTLWFSYTVSQFANSKSGGFTLLIAVTLLFGMFLPYLSFGVKNADGSLWDFVLNFRDCFPAFAFTSSFRKNARNVVGVARCKHFTKVGIEKYCGVGDDVTKEQIELRRVSCCENCPRIPFSTRCYDQHATLRHPSDPFLQSNEELLKGEPLQINREVNYDYDPQSIYNELLTMYLVGLFFNILTLFIDSDGWQKLVRCVLGARSRAFQTDVEDEDIINESDKVERMVTRHRMNREGLVVHNLCKSYGTYPTLHNLSFTVHPGESFGIIGVNGAGKTTLFSVLTGLVANSYGNVFSVDSNLNSRRSDLRSKMCYSPPQSSAIFPYMSCLENILLFAKLRGLNSKEAKESANALMEKMGLAEFAKKLARHCSGGVRKRLCMAMALVGDSPIVLFDEPTSAADPTSRRQCWEILKETKASGRTLIFSSHQIKECADLCQRMVILVDGKFQCIGTPSHLREKFGSGYKLMVKLIPGPAESQGYVSSLSESIVHTFNPCSLRDRRRNVIQYVVHDSNFSWDFLFQMMEHIKLRYNDLVEDYAFSNTTMEEVFLSFVILQNCGRILDPATTGCCPP